MITQATVNSALRLLGFNWMGGRIYVPDLDQESGYRKLDHKDPWLDEPMTVETPQWHFFATDANHYYCSAVLVEAVFPLGPVKVRKDKVETIQVDPEALGEGRYLNRINRELIRDLDILSAPVERSGIVASGQLVGIQKFGIYVVALTESEALRNLPRWIGLLGVQCFQQGYNHGLADHILKSGTAGMMKDLQRLGEEIGKQKNDPNSQLNKQVDELFPSNG